MLNKKKFLIEFFHEILLKHYKLRKKHYIEIQNKYSEHQLSNSQL